MEKQRRQEEKDRCSGPIKRTMSAFLDESQWFTNSASDKRFQQNSLFIEPSQELAVAGRDSSFMALRSTLSSVAFENQVATTSCASSKQPEESEESEPRFEYRLRQRRGKKAQELSEYEATAQTKLSKISTQMGAAGERERLQLQNKAACLNQRLRKKQNEETLVQLLTGRDQEMAHLIAIIQNCVDSETLNQIFAQIQSQLPRVAKHHRERLQPKVD